MASMNRYENQAQFRGVGREWVPPRPANLEPVDELAQELLKQGPGSSLSFCTHLGERWRMECLAQSSRRGVRGAVVALEALEPPLDLGRLQLESPEGARDRLFLVAQIISAMSIPGTAPLRLSIAGWSQLRQDSDLLRYLGAPETPDVPGFQPPWLVQELSPHTMGRHLPGGRALWVLQDENSPASKVAALLAGWAWGDTDLHAIMRLLVSRSSGGNLLERFLAGSLSEPEITALLGEAESIARDVIEHSPPNLDSYLELAGRMESQGLPFRPFSTVVQGSETPRGRLAVHSSGGAALILKVHPPTRHDYTTLGTFPRKKLAGLLNPAQVLQAEEYWKSTLRKEPPGSPGWWHLKGLPLSFTVDHWQEAATLPLGDILAAFRQAPAPSLVEDASSLLLDMLIRTPWNSLSQFMDTLPVVLRQLAKVNDREADLLRIHLAMRALSEGVQSVGKLGCQLEPMKKLRLGIAIQASQSEQKPQGVLEHDVATLRARLELRNGDRWEPVVQERQWFPDGPGLSQTVPSQPVATVLVDLRSGHPLLPSAKVACATDGCIIALGKPPAQLRPAPGTCLVLENGISLPSAQVDCVVRKLDGQAVRICTILPPSRGFAQHDPELIHADPGQVPPVRHRSSFSSPPRGGTDQVARASSQDPADLLAEAAARQLAFPPRTDTHSAYYPSYTLCVDSTAARARLVEGFRLSSNSSGRTCTVAGGELPGWSALLSAFQHGSQAVFRGDHPLSPNQYGRWSFLLPERTLDVLVLGASFSDKQLSAASLAAAVLSTEHPRWRVELPPAPANSPIWHSPAPVQRPVAHEFRERQAMGDTRPYSPYPRTEHHVHRRRRRAPWRWMKDRLARRRGEKRAGPREGVGTVSSRRWLVLAFFTGIAGLALGFLGGRYLSAGSIGFFGSPSGNQQGAISQYYSVAVNQADETTGQGAQGLWLCSEYGDILHLDQAGREIFICGDFEPQPGDPQRYLRERTCLPDPVRCADTPGLRQHELPALLCSREGLLMALDQGPIAAPATYTSFEPPTHPDACAAAWYLEQVPPFRNVPHQKKATMDPGAGHPEQPLPAVAPR